MSAIFFRRLSVIFLVGFLFSACAAVEGADPAPRIVAVGDLHGDYEAYESILIAAGISDKRGRWQGGDTIFVQTGDIADRGPDSRKIIDHLRKLQKKAPKKGGAVITLVGNHEAMNMTGDLRSVHPGEYEAFKDRNSEKRRAQLFEKTREATEKYYLENVDSSLSSEAIREAFFDAAPLGRVEHNVAWSASGDIGNWVADNPAVALIGDTLFLHGGLSAEYSIFTLDDINDRVAAALKARDESPTSIIADPLGPLWYRGNVQRDSAAAMKDAIAAAADGGAVEFPTRPSMEEEIEMVLEAYEAARIVVGHTPNIEGIRASLGGRVIQIDTGASAYYDGVKSYLEIVGGDIIAHNVDTGQSRILSSAGEAGK